MAFEYNQVAFIALFLFIRRFSLFLVSWFRHSLLFKYKIHFHLCTQLRCALQLIQIFMLIAIWQLSRLDPNFVSHWTVKAFSCCCLCICIAESVCVCVSQLSLAFVHCLSSRRLAINFTISWQLSLKKWGAQKKATTKGTTWRQFKTKVQEALINFSDGKGLSVCVRICSLSANFAQLFDNNLREREIAQWLRKHGQKTSSSTNKIANWRSCWPSSCESE